MVQYSKGERKFYDLLCADGRTKYDQLRNEGADPATAFSKARALGFKQDIMLTPKQITLKNYLQGTDWAVEAVDKIIADLSDRRGIKWEWEKIDEDVKAEIRAKWADIIRETV